MGRHSEVLFLGAKLNPMMLSVEGKPAKVEVWLSNTEQVLTVAEPPLTYYSLDNTYAFVIMDKTQPDKLIAARKGSPLVIGVGEDEFFLGSDASPIIEYTHKVVYLDDEQIAYIQRGKDLRITDLKSVEQTPQIRELEMSLSEIEKGESSADPWAGAAG